MQQSNFIFAMIMIAFIVFITLRGELPAYVSLLRGSTETGSAVTTAGSAGGNEVTGGINLSGIDQTINSLNSDINQLNQNNTQINSLQNEINQLTGGIQ